MKCKFDEKVECDNVENCKFKNFEECYWNAVERLNKFEDSEEE